MNVEIQAFASFPDPSNNNMSGVSDKNAMNFQSFDLACAIKL